MLSFVLGAIGACIIPAGAAFLFPFGAVARYAVTVASLCGMQAAISIFSVFAVSVIQQNTPGHMVGKVMAYTSAVTMCAQPVGQMVYGFLFDGFPYFQLSGEKPRRYTCKNRRNRQCTLRPAVIFCIQAKNRPHDKRKPHQCNPHDKESGYRRQKQQLHDIRLFFHDKTDTAEKIIFYHGQDISLKFPGLITQFYKTFQKCRDKKAYDTCVHHRFQAKCPIQNPPKQRRSQIRNRRYLVHNSVSPDNIIPCQHLGDTRLHGGRLKGPQNRERHNGQANIL